MAKVVCEDCGEVLAENLSEQEAQEMAGDGHQAHDLREEGLDESADPDDMEDRLEDKFDEKMDEVQDDDKVEEAVSDAESYEDIDGEEPKMLVGMDDVSLDYSRWSRIEQEGKRLSSTFQDKLRQKQRDSTKRGQRSGRFDSRAMIEADRGSARVFKRNDPGKKLDYGAWFILDRSSSMSGRYVEPAEDAVAKLMVALEEAGVDTELVDFMGSTTRVVKTRSQSVDDEAHNVIRGDTDGGTPLSQVMKMVNERVNHESGKPFVVVITDGKPNRGSEFLDAVDDCSAPVVGVTIGNGNKLDRERRERLFAAHVDVTDMSELTAKLDELARKIMF